jgi:hypothetical protein
LRDGAERLRELEATIVDLRAQLRQERRGAEAAQERANARAASSGLPWLTEYDGEAHAILQVGAVNDEHKSAAGIVPHASRFAARR